MRTPLAPPMAQITCRYCSTVADYKDSFLTWFLFEITSVLDVILGNVTTPCRVCGQRSGLILLFSPYPCKYMRCTD